MIIKLLLDAQSLIAEMNELFVDSCSLTAQSYWSSLIFYHIIKYYDVIKHEHPHT